MVRQTFLNLPVGKQNRILESARSEFARASLKDASVANIIKAAGIPRGSFYQYFTDLNDIFYHILETHSKEIKQKLTSNLVRYNGDIIKSFADLYQYILGKIDLDEFYFKNIFLNMDYELEKMFLPNLEDNLNEIIQLIDITNMNIYSKLQLIYIIEIVEAVLMRNLVQSFKRNVSREKDVEIFIKELLLIKDGIYKS